MKMEATT